MVADWRKQVKIEQNQLWESLVLQGIFLYAVLGTLCLYNGTSCVAALHKAGKQPYLLSGTERFDFVGYHMMAAMYGVICIAITVMLILLVRWKRRNNK